MTRSILSVALAMVTSAVPAITYAEQGAVTAPSFGELESSFAASGTLTHATAALAPSLTPATALSTAQKRLTAAGAHCWPGHHTPGLVKCLYHQFDLSDGAADDIRWLITLHSDGLVLHDFSVTREVDRHGGA